MPSDLQRVASGLVECLDEVPQVAAHLQRTAERCRENAALAIAASHGRATVAAQQLDAAARACEEAAHYLSMAPPKAKAWAERLVGAARSSDRPDVQSADRNKATGGVGDVAERDVFGRIKRTSLPFKPTEVAEGKEPPLIKVARKAFEKLRKKQQKEDQDRELHEPLEIEIVVAEGGKAEVVDQEAPEERDFEIKVELDAAAAELLKAMAEHGKRSWTAATLTIAPDRVTATFTYPDLPKASEPPVIDVELPEPPSHANDRPRPEQIDVPEIDAALDEQPEFDPAFHPRALGDDFAPGVHDPHHLFKAKELAAAKRLEAEGWRVDARMPNHTVQNRKNPDVMVRKSSADAGVAVEFKTLESDSSSAIKRNITQGSGQVRSVGEVVIDGRDVGLTEADAWRAFRRACGQPGTSVAPRVHVILGDGRLITYTKEN